MPFEPPLRQTAEERTFLPSDTFLFVVAALKELLSVKVRHLVTVHARIEIDSQESLDVTLFHPLHLKPLIGYDFFRAVDESHKLFGLCGFAVQCKKELPCGRCFGADVVDEIEVFLQDVNDLLVGFLFYPVLDIVAVVVETFTGIRAGNLNIGNCRQNHLQMMYLYFDVFGGQH